MNLILKQGVFFCCFFRKEMILDMVHTRVFIVVKEQKEWLHAGLCALLLYSYSFKYS